MKKIISILLITHNVFSTTYHLFPKEPITSRTFMYVRPIFQNIALERSLWDRTLFHKDRSFAFQVTGFFQKAFNTHNILSFFMPEFETPTLQVSANPYTGDVNPHWLELPSNFSSTLTYDPNYSSYGVYFEARQMLGSIADIPFFKNIWLYFATPFTVNKQNLNLVQTNVENAGPSTDTVYDLTTAFNNPSWNYLKTAELPARKRFAEVRAGYGTTIFATDRAHAITYMAISIPTYRRPKNHYLFETQMGFDGHLGYIWGLNLEFPVNRACDPYQVNIRLDLENTYLMKNHRYRTFDLLNKPWSRYLLFRDKNQPLDITIPGVNVMTQRVMVAPHSTVDFAFGVRLLTDNFQSEIGYGMWAHGGEKIRFIEPFQNIYGIAGSTPLTSASRSTIKTVAANDAVFTPIQLTDFDIDSAKMPSVWVHKIFTTLGYTSKGERDFFIGIGGFAEIPQQKPRELYQFGMHFKVGAGI